MKQKIILKVGEQIKIGSKIRTIEKIREYTVLFTDGFYTDKGHVKTIKLYS